MKYVSFQQISYISKHYHINYLLQWCLKYLLHTYPMLSYKFYLKTSSWSANLLLIHSSSSSSAVNIPGFLRGYWTGFFSFIYLFISSIFILDIFMLSFILNGRTHFYKPLTHFAKMLACMGFFLIFIFST